MTVPFPPLAALVLLLVAPASSPQESGERVDVVALPPVSDGVDEVLHVVGDVEIRASDVFRMLDLSVPADSAEVQRQLVLTTLARLQAQAEGIDVPAAALSAQVEKAISEQRARFALSVDAELPLEEFVRRRFGMDEEAYRAEVAGMALANLFIERAVRLHTLRTARDELQLILVEDEALAKEIGDKLAQGASFSVLAKKHSVHPGAANGGFMPALPAGIDLPLVAGRATLGEGEVLGPAPITVEGRDYWRFVRLVARLPAREGDWAGLRELVEADLRERPLHPDEVAIFEADMADRYRVRSPVIPP